MKPLRPIPTALVLIGLALLYLLPAGWRVGASDATYHMEQMSLLPSQETWLRMNDDEPDAWLRPTKYGAPRIRKPPMLVWLNLIAWHDLTPENSTIDLRVARARYVALGLALLGILSTYLVTRLTFNRHLAWRAGVVLASMFAILKQGRHATFDTHLLGWVMLAHAGGFLFLHLRGRQGSLPTVVAAAVWTVAAATAAIMTKGPVALVALIPALVVYPLVHPAARRDALRLGLILFLGCGALCLPWYVYILKAVPHAAEILFHEFRQPRSRPAPFFYYLVFFGLAWVWTASLVWRLIAWRDFRRRQDWFPILAFVVSVLILSLAEAKRQRYLVPMLPYAAIAAAQWWQRMGQTAPAGSRRWPEVFRVAHAGPLPLLGICAGAFILLQPRLVAWGVLKDVDVPGVPAWLAVAAGAAMVAGGLGVWHLMRRERYAAALIATVLWWNAAYLFGMHFYVDSYHGAYRYREVAEAVRAEVGDRPLYYVDDPDDPARPPDDRFYFYLARQMPTAGVDALPATDVAYALTRVDSAAREDLDQRGWLPVMPVPTRAEYELLRSPPCS